MGKKDSRAQVGRIALIFPAAFVLVSAALFLPAGTLDYWEAWVYCGILFVPALFAVSYFIRKDPELIRRRMKYKEKGAVQKTIIKAVIIVFIIGFLIPGFDHRYGWSNVPAELAMAAAGIVLLGYILSFLALKENSYASRIVWVEKGQKTITTGPYAVVRHPMYLGVMLMLMFTPVALGSYWALFAFLPLLPLIVARTLDEERVLLKELPGYKEYCRKTRYRLIPFVW